MEGPEMGFVYEHIIRERIFNLTENDAEYGHAIGARFFWLCGLEPVRTLLAACMRTKGLERRVMGLQFLNPIGLAAGYDKWGITVSGAAALGFGHIDVGTSVPRPQPGRPRPRVFRLPEDEALINRMGFNSPGEERIFWNLKKHRGAKIVVGVNVGKNADTPQHLAYRDYVEGVRFFYGTASYYTINISSPNTPGLRDLQKREAITGIIDPVQDEAERLAEIHGVQRPIVVKVAPDLSDTEFDDILGVLIDRKVDGICIGNTTTDRPSTLRSAYSLCKEEGGLSGPPLFERTCRRTARARKFAPRIAIISAGGASTGSDAWCLIEECGADLVSVLTAVVYKGPGVARQMNYALKLNSAAPDARHAAHLRIAA